MENVSSWCKGAVRDRRKASHHTLAVAVACGLQAMLLKMNVGQGR
jgi:hypothetical protein